MNEAARLVLEPTTAASESVEALAARHTAWVAVEFDDDLATHSKFVRRTVPGPARSTQIRPNSSSTWPKTRASRAGCCSRRRQVGRLREPHHAELEQAYRLTTPPHASFDAAQDKRQVYARAQALGIAVPSTWYTDSLDEAAALDLEYR